MDVRATSYNKLLTVSFRGGKSLLLLAGLRGHDRP
jgi:hypothetical protein